MVIEVIVHSVAALVLAHFRCGNRTEVSEIIVAEHQRNAVKLRIPQLAEGYGTARDMPEENVLMEIGKLIARHPGDRDVLIYKRNGQILSSGKKGGVSATLDFAEEAALLLGNYNVKILKMDR